MAERPHAGHRIPKIRWPSSIAGAMTVVVPQLAQGGGDGWNSGGDGWNSSDMIPMQQQQQIPPDEDKKK